jgi:hypothetical protein
MSRSSASNVIVDPPFDEKMIRVSNTGEFIAVFLNEEDVDSAYLEMSFQDDPDAEKHHPIFTVLGPDGSGENEEFDRYLKENEQTVYVKHRSHWISSELFEYARKLYEEKRNARMEGRFDVLRGGVNNVISQDYDVYF